MGCLKLNTEYYSELETKAFLKALTLKKTAKTLRRSLPYGETFFERRDYWNTPYKFNAKELDEETGMYYYGARYYTPEVSIWLSVDPLADKYPSTSSFMYCLGNPVVFIDPNGMNHDKFGLKDNGEVVLLERQDGPHELYKIDDQGNIQDVNGDGEITEEVDFVTFNGSSVEDVKVTNVNRTNYFAENVGSYKAPLIEFSNKAEAMQIFKFFADNVNAEISLLHLEKEGKSMFSLQTTYSAIQVSGAGDIASYYMDKGWSIIADYHNHPDGNNEPSGYLSTRYNGLGSSDKGKWFEIQKRCPNAQFFIYTKNDGFKNHTNTLKK